MRESLMLPRHILKDYPLFKIQCSNSLYLLYRDLCLIKFHGKWEDLLGSERNRNSIVDSIKFGG